MSTSGRLPRCDALGEDEIDHPRSRGDIGLAGSIMRAGRKAGFGSSAVKD